MSTAWDEVGIVSALYGPLAIHRGEASFGSVEHRGVPPEAIGFRLINLIQILFKYTITIDTSC